MKTLCCFTLAAVFLRLVGCSSDEGAGGSSQEIGLEKNKLVVSGGKQTSVVKAKSGDWNIYRLISTDETGAKEYLNEHYIYDDGKGNVYNRYKEIMSYDWFIVSHTQSNIGELFVELDENNTGKRRTLYIYLRSGAMGLYSDNLIVSQEPK